MSQQPGVRPEVEIDPDMAELVEYFVGELPDRVRSLEAAAGANHLDQLQSLAHQLKGAAPGFGFPSIGEAARAVELGLKQAEPEQRSLELVRSELEALLHLCRSYCRPS